MSVGLRIPPAMASVVVAIAVAGCSSPTEGQPSAEDGPTSTSQSEDPSSDETTSSGSPNFSNTQLCGLLTAEEAQQLGGSATGEAGYSTFDGHPQCQWSADTGLTVGFQEGLQAAGVRTGEGITNTPTTVDGLTAVQSHVVEPNREFCQVLVNLTDDSLMSAGASVRDTGEGKYVVCDVATEFANIIIPKAK